MGSQRRKNLRILIYNLNEEKDGNGLFSSFFVVCESNLSNRNIIITVINMYLTLKLRRKIVLVIASILFIAVLAGFLCIVPANSQSRKIPIYKVGTDEKTVALTFNCADGDEDVVSILTTLDKYNIKATFFPLGIWVDAHPDSLKKIYERGHEIGNHSYSHADCVQLSHIEIYDEIMKCNERVKSITGSYPDLFRCPSGSYDNKTIETAQASGMIPIQWSVDSVDWRNNSQDEIFSRVVDKISCGDIIQFHTGTANTAGVLERIITALKEKGYSFKTVGELIYSAPYRIDHAGVQYKIDELKSNGQ